MIVDIDERSAAGFGTAPMMIAAAVASQAADAVMIDVSMPHGLTIAAWLRANPSMRFPVYGYAFGPEPWCKQDLFQVLFAGPHHVDRFFDSSSEGQDPTQGPAAIPPEALAAAQLAAANALLVQLKPDFRHDFRNHVAAARLLLGAIRTGAVDRKEGLRVLSGLGDSAPKKNADEMERLLKWYVDAVLACGPGAGIEPLPRFERPVLLIDDQAETAGWNSVLCAIFGPSYTGVCSSREAEAFLQARIYAVALVDLDLENEDGLEVIARLRATRFDLPLVAFSAYDRADLAMAALTAGADAYFAKEVALKDDRDSEDYFRRFERVIASLPGDRDSMREAWREFAAIEAKLEGFESQCHKRSVPADPYQHLRAGAFFRMAYYFGTVPATVEQKERLVDLRQRAFFEEPALAARPCLHLALKLFTNRLTQRNDEHANSTEDLGHLAGEPVRRCVLDADWTKLYEVASPAWRHPDGNAAPSQLAPAFLAVVRFFQAALRGRGLLAPVQTPIVTPRRPVSPPAGDHDQRRRGGMQVLQRGFEGKGKLRGVSRFLVIDDQPAAWRDQDWLEKICRLRPRFIAAQDESAVLAEIEQSIPLAGNRFQPVVLLDLDWRGDGGGAALSVLQRLKQSHPWLPVIVVSGLNSSVQLQRSLFRGATNYFLLHPVPTGDEDAYACQFRELLEDAGRIACESGIRKVWNGIQEVEAALTARFPANREFPAWAAGCLKLAAFCYYSDHNPVDLGRERRLLGGPPGKSEMLLRVFYFLIFQPLEALWKGRDDSEFAWMHKTRTRAIKKPYLDEYDPGDYARKVLRKMLKIIEHPVAVK